MKATKDLEILNMLHWMTHNKKTQRESTHVNSRWVFSWGTRTRTRKDRTRICSVANYTIPQTVVCERDALSFRVQKYNLFSIWQTSVPVFFHKIKKKPLFLRKSQPFYPQNPKLLTNFATQKSDSSAVGSALRSGRRGRAFESPLSDVRENL